MYSLRESWRTAYKSVVMEGAAFARKTGCDFVVALGGGAVLDASVAIAAMANQPAAICGIMCVAEREKDFRSSHPDFRLSP